MNPLSPADTLDLAGPWLLQLDPGDAGIAGRWFARPLAEKINLPGSLPQSGFGHPVAVDTKWTGSIFNRDYFTPMLDHPTGRYMLGYALISILVGHVIIQRIARIRV